MVLKIIISLKFVDGYWTETIGVTEDGKFVDEEIDASYYASPVVCK